MCCTPIWGPEVVASSAVSWQLPPALIEAIDGLAAAEGASSDQIAAALLQLGLQERGAAPYGRCSLRIGVCSEGPQPLPLQQP